MRVLLAQQIRNSIRPQKIPIGNRFLLNLECCFLKPYYAGVIHSFLHYSTAITNLLGTNHVKDIKIPVTYGNIAAKAWGEETGYPILALHGWLDNCGTFDNLFPLLSDKFYIIAVDAPGHGMSSHKPLGSFYTDISMVIDFKKVTDFLGWNKFSIIGHSFGGIVGLIFSSIFSENIHKLIVLEAAKPSSRAINLFPLETIKAIKNLMKIEESVLKLPTVYTQELAAKRLQEGLLNEITLEGAKILNKRGTRTSECGKGVIFTRDIRCRPLEEFSRSSDEFVLQFIAAVKCELLIILGNKRHPKYDAFTPEVLDPFYDIYRKNAKKFIFQHVEGNHFVHLNNAERIAPAINDFLSM